MLYRPSVTERGVTALTKVHCNFSVPNLTTLRL